MNNNNIIQILHNLIATSKLTMSIKTFKPSVNCPFLDQNAQKSSKIFFYHSPSDKLFFHCFPADTSRKIVGEGHSAKFKLVLPTAACKGQHDFSRNNIIQKIIKHHVSVILYKFFVVCTWFARIFSWFYVNFC